MDTKEIGDQNILFRSKRKNKCLRLKKATSDSEEEQEDEQISSLLEDAKELRKLRRRPNGVSAVGLALGKKLTNEEELVVDDPFKLQTGGFIDMKNLRGKKSGIEELDAVNLGSVFSAETNRRDEDADMMKYIDEELYKRKGSIAPNKLKQDQNTSNSEGPLKPEDMLFVVPEHLRHATTKKSEEMLSNQMLSGIPEVDLGIEERIRNIEATEEAKLQLLRDRLKKKDKGMSFVPTNMAVNFVQHNRFNIDESDQPKVKKVRKVVEERKPSPPKPKPVVEATSKPKDDDEKATDDFHFEKFKKQFRRF